MSIIGSEVWGRNRKILEYIATQQYVSRQPEMHSRLSIYAMGIGFLTAASVSLFVGTEYSAGTIRNKLISGPSRAAIYFSNLIACSAAGLFMCLAYLLPAAAAGIPLCGIETADFRYIVSMFLCSFVMTLAFTSLCTLVGMLCQNKAVTAVVTILSVCLFFVASIYISARLNEPETYPEVTALAEDGSVISTRDVPNPGYLRGTQRQIYEFLDEFLPTGQSVILSRGDQGSPFLLMSAYSAGIAAAAAGIGIFLFRKRDIK